MRVLTIDNQETSDITDGTYIVRKVLFQVSVLTIDDKQKNLPPKAI